MDAKRLSTPQAKPFILAIILSMMIPLLIGQVVNRAGSTATLSNATNISLVAATQTVNGVFSGRLDTNSTAPLAGWAIDTPWSQYEGTAPTTTQNMHGFVIRSLGSPNNTTNGGGDGYVQITSNLSSSNSSWHNYKGDIDYSATTNFNNRRTVIRTGNTFVQLGGSSNLNQQLQVTAAGLKITAGAPNFTVTGLSHTTTLNSSNVVVGGTLFSSATPTAIAGATAGETNLIGPAVIPAMALTNDMDTVEFITTARIASTPASHVVKVYFGSTAIFATPTFTTSNCLLTIQGRIINQNTSGNGVNQYVVGNAYWTSLGGATAPPYAATNWSLYIGETNWLDTRLVMAVTNSVANVVTNEMLQVRVHPAGPYTF